MSTPEQPPTPPAGIMSGPGTTSDQGFDPHGPVPRTVDWSAGPGHPAVVLVDQTVLPATERLLRLTTVAQVVDAIRRLAVRGAPAIGVAGAFGVALAAFAARAAGDGARGGSTRGAGTGGDGTSGGGTGGDGTSGGGTGGDVGAAVAALRSARPTAVNLARAVDRVAARLPEGPAAVLAEACAVRDEEIASSAAMAARGMEVVGELCGRAPRLLTHCNSGALAAVEGGTALGVILALHAAGRLGGVVACETRPLLQGARLTAWELARAGVPFRLATDGAGPFLIARGEVDAVVLGADRICANGDVVNKIGTYAHALGAARAGVPFLVVAPESTVDLATPDGSAVVVEDRGPGEVTGYAGTPVAPAGTAVANPAFDVTPADLVTAVITDRRVVWLSRGGTFGGSPTFPVDAGR